MPQAPVAAGEKLYCLSYAPFRGRQTPLDPTTLISAAQIEDDLSRLAKITNCVRTYSTDYGLDQIAGIAARHGLKVMQGLWLSSHPDKNRDQIETAMALANRYPDTIRAVVVGNEVLLRGEMTATDLADTIRAVKARVPVPVTYADVWEFWLRNRDVAAAVDFVTIHILPYWEDFPIPARDAAAHVEAIRRQVVAAFPARTSSSARSAGRAPGRMREGALPSPSNQARVIQDVLALAAREKFRVNVIEAFDAAVEARARRHRRRPLGPARRRQARSEIRLGRSRCPIIRGGDGRRRAGLPLRLLVFGAAMRARRAATPLALWLAVSANATAGGVLIGWTIANVPIESLGVGGWLRSLAFAAVALLAPPLVERGDAARHAAAAVVARCSVRRASASANPIARAIGGILIAAVLLAILAALGLVFDPRYRDFPFAPLTAAVMPLLLHSLLMPRPGGPRGAAELAGAGVLALSVPYIVLNEGLANWQSLWTCAALVALAISLARVRDAPG